MSDDLLPCPFCGNKPSTLRQNGVVQATCDNFDCPAFDVFAPIAAWNRRAIPATDARTQALREAAAHIIAKAKAIEADEADWRTWGGPDPRGQNAEMEALERARLLRSEAAAILALIDEARDD